MSFDLTPGPSSFADALAWRDFDYDSGDRGPCANLQEDSLKEAFRRSAERVATPRANQIQLRFPGFDLPNQVRPEKRPWPKTIAPAAKPKARAKVRRDTGVDNIHEMTFSQIGDVLGVSYERVRQIEARALKKLRIECEKRGITAEVLFEYWRRDR